MSIIDGEIYKRLALKKLLLEDEVCPNCDLVYCECWVEDEI